MSAKTFLCMYTVQDEWNKDPLATFEKAAGMGYSGVELSIEEKNDSRALRAKLDELGLVAVSTHVNFDDMNANSDFYFEQMGILGIKYLGIPWLDRDRLPGGENYEATKQQIIALGERCNKEGVVLFYHNHNFEFEKVDGVCKLDILFSDIPAELLKCQLDVCWTTVGGQDPAAYIKKYASRMPLIHLKDFTAECSLARQLKNFCATNEKYQTS